MSLHVKGKLVEAVKNIFDIGAKLDEDQNYVARYSRRRLARHYSDLI